ncbi:MAG: hypothetical protein JO048_07920, partial [Methylobacteriaceae bacterium]|nr:hypothetical protein [Methylobacteriaceae bacterium]
MTMFLLAMTLIGAVASLYLSWVFVTLVGFLAVPIYLAVALSTGTPTLAAVVTVIGGFVLLQIGYVLAGWLLPRDRPDGRLSSRRRRAAAGAETATPNMALGRTSAWPLFGGWLPLAAFFEPPCRADGSPWDGVDDPGYRVPTFVLGWFGRAVSVAVGKPRGVTAESREARRHGIERDPARQTANVDAARRAGPGSPHG